MAITHMRAGGMTRLHPKNRTAATLDQQRRGETTPMTVGELSQRTGVSIKNLRLYTDWGMISAAGRSESNYRLFDSDALWCVRYIVEARRLGLTLAEIRELTRACRERSDSIGLHLARKLKASRARLRANIAELQETVRRIDEFECEHGAEFARGGGALWYDDLRGFLREA